MDSGGRNYQCPLCLRDDMSNKVIWGWSFSGGGGCKWFGHGSDIVVGWCDLDFDVVAENGWRIINVRDVGNSNEFWGKDNGLTLDLDYWEHPGCSWISWIAAKSHPNRVWCPGKVIICHYISHNEEYHHLLTLIAH